MTESNMENDVQRKGTEGKKDERKEKQSEQKKKKEEKKPRLCRIYVRISVKHEVVPVEAALLCTMGQNIGKHRMNSRQIVHFPMSSGTNEVSERADE